MTKTGGRRRRASSGKVGGAANDEPPGDGGPDEAAMFIAETVAALTGLARRHRLVMLARLLEMSKWKPRNASGSAASAIFNDCPTQKLTARIFRPRKIVSRSG